MQFFPRIKRYSALLGSGITPYIFALLTIFIIAWMQFTPLHGPSSTADEWLRDQFIQFRSTLKPEDRFIIVDINEASLKDKGAWPWSRSRVAELIDALLHDYGAKGVALDIIFPAPADTAGDAKLAALAQTKMVVFAQAIDYVERASALRIGELSGEWGLSRSEDLIAKGFIANHEKLNKPPITGNIGFIPASDGVIRHLPMFTQVDGKSYPTLSLALLNCCSSKSLSYHDIHSFQRIPFERDLDSYTVIPAATILDLAVSPAVIAGKLVIIGSSSLGLADSVATPLTANTSGFLVHAEMLSALLDQAEGKVYSYWQGNIFAFLFTISVFALFSITLTKRSALFNTALLFSASLFWLFCSYWICLHDNNFSPANPLVFFFFLLAFAIPFQWQSTQRRARKLLNTLNHYVAPAVVNEILNSGLQDPLAPRQHHMTTLVADMEGYTKHVEGLSLEDAALITSDFLDCLTQPVLSYRGTLDKYTGDGLVAFWGAPILDENHADSAIDAAIQMVQAVEVLNAKRVSQNKAALRVRIGIESGIAISGDFGSSSRSIYTAVGDSVNTAARLEEMAKNIPYNIIIGPSAAKLTKRHALISLGNITLRGKQNKTEIFTLLPA